jgi:hypothetical protein
MVGQATDPQREETMSTIAEVTKAGYGDQHQAWDEGYASGKNVMARLMSPTHFAEETDNPYPKGQS